MRHTFLPLGLAAAVLSAACGRTMMNDRDVTRADSDAAARPDINLPDSSDPPIDIPVMPDVITPVDVPRDTRVPRCGDSILDPGESCDDGNNANGDGCNAMCRWEARCGDGRVDMGEVCDDGNNRSGDGCRSDCRSDERCGNMVVDTVRGEVCDGTPGCAPDCRSILSCGNGTVEPTEQCDDGNTTRWDGCAPDCRIEQAIGLSAFFIAGDSGRIGCDFTGDRMADNTFSRALGPAAGVLNTAITNGVSNGQLLLQMAFLGLEDRLGVNDADLRVGWLTGADGDGDNRNNGDPGNPQRVNAMALNPLGLPAANYQSAIAMSAIDGGPEDIVLDLPGPMGMPFTFRVTRSRISGTLMNDGTRVSALRNGVLCGAIPTRDLAALPNFFASLGGGMGGGTRSTFLEALVGGYTIMIPFFGNISVGPAQPDVDLDGDGLERFEATAGNNRTPPAITACIDGDGTRLMGPACQRDPRMADGFTSAFQMNGVWIRYVGVSGTLPTPDAGVRD